MGSERMGGRLGRSRRGTGPEAWLWGGGLVGGLRRGGAVRREEAVSSAGELGVEGEVLEDVGEGRGSFTLPSKGRGTAGAPGRWRGPPW